MKLCLFKHIIACIFVALLLCPASPLQAQSKKELQQEKNRIEAELKKLDRQLSNAKRNAKLSKNQLAVLDKKIKERNRLIRNINQQMSALNQQIMQTQDSVAIMHNHVDSLKNEYAKVIRTLYREKDNLNGIALLFDTPNYNKAFLRNKYYHEYSAYRKHQATFIRQRERELADLTLQLQAQRHEKTSLLSQEQRQHTQLTKEQKQQERNLNTAETNQKKLQQQITKKQQEKKTLEKQIQKLIAEEVAKARTKKNASRTMSNTSTSQGSKEGGKDNEPAAATPRYDDALSNDFEANKRKLSWPAFYKSVIREFGRYKHESGGENMSNGIELRCSTGAAVYCIFDGTVTRVFTCPNGTKGVIVRHGEYMSVYANLASVSVKEGSAVKTKQVLGKVYAEAEAATCDFNFQIWKGTTPVNPRTFLK